MSQRGLWIVSEGRDVGARSQRPLFFPWRTLDSAAGGGPRRTQREQRGRGRHSEALTGQSTHASPPAMLALSMVPAVQRTSFQRPPRGRAGETPAASWPCLRPVPCELVSAQSDWPRPRQASTRTPCFCLWSS